MIIHLDTNVLIDIATAGAAAGDKVEKWLEEGRVLAAASTVWFEYIDATLATSNGADFLMFTPFGLKLEVV